MTKYELQWGILSTFAPIVNGRICSDDLEQVIAELSSKRCRYNAEFQIIRWDANNTGTVLLSLPKEDHL